MGGIKVLEETEEVPTGFGSLYDAPDPPEDVVYLHEGNVHLLEHPDPKGTARRVTIVLGSGMRNGKWTMTQCWKRWIQRVSKSVRFQGYKCDLVVYYDEDPGDENVKTLEDVWADGRYSMRYPNVHRLIIHRVRKQTVHILHSPPRWHPTAPAPRPDHDGLAKLLEERIRIYLDRDLDLLGRGARASECKYSLGASGGSSDAPSRRVS